MASQPLSPWRQRLEAERERLEQQDRLIAQRDEAAAAAEAAQADADARELAAFGGALGRRLQRTLRRRGVQAVNTLEFFLATGAVYAAWALNRSGSLKPMAKLVSRHILQTHVC